MAQKLMRAKGALVVMLALPASGCIGVDSEADRSMAEQRLARPSAIVVQDFAISPDASQAAPSASASDKNDAAAAARKFSNGLTTNLVDEIRKMGLPAVDADAPLPSTGGVVSIEGRFVSVPAGDSAEPAIVALANSWPDVVVDVEIYDTSETGDRLVEDQEFRISESAALLPAGEPADEPTEPSSGDAANQPAISPAVQAKLDAATRDGAKAIAKELETFFAGHGWIAPPPQS